MNERARPEIGRRVAELRKLRGLTQAGLAARLHRSESWVTKIERGARPLDSMAVLLELAEALAVPMSRLTGEHDAQVNGRAGIPALAELRHVLDRPTLADSQVLEPRPVGEITAETAALRRRFDIARNNFSVLLPRLPSLLGQAQSAARIASAMDRRRACAALVVLYRLAAMEFRCWGDLPRARVSLDRALTAAEQSGDPMLVSAVGVFTLQHMWHTDPAAAVDAADEFIGFLSRDSKAGTAAGTAVLGALRGYAALAAASAGDETEARWLKDRADSAAAALGRDGAPHGVFFGPTYNTANDTILLVVLGRPQEAARRGEGIWLPELANASVTRAGFHSVFLARAHSMYGRDDDALAVIAAGLKLAPEVLRDQAFEGETSRSIVRGILRRRRHVSDNLRRMARHLGLSD